MPKAASTAFFLSAILLATPLPAAEREVSFNRDIKPILAGKCFACHGPDEKERQADLRLDQADAAHASGVLKGADDAVAAILIRVASSDPDEQMPPASSKKPGLTADEIALLQRWVEQGAKYDAHWAFVPPVKHDPPEVSDASWSHTAIDRFIRAGQEANGLTGSPEADKRTLLRRLSIDMVGLPPTPEEVAAFEADESPEAYERQVDRLLASEHFGERMAIYWLDVVRYADSIGYHSDNPRNVSPFRDYVIRSFNHNLPYDQFLREQIAGDLIPDATLWQRVGSGHNRLLQTTGEGGAQAKEYVAKYAADRVRNFGAAFLALTTGCAECHDHKFDPVSAREFYSLQAFFADIQEPPISLPEAGIPVPHEEQEAELARRTEAVAAAQVALDQAVAKLLESEPEPVVETAWQTAKYESTEVQGESALESQDDGSLRTTGTVAAQESYVLILAETPQEITGLRLEALSDEKLPAKGPGNASNGNFVLSEFKAIKVDKEGKEHPLKTAKVVASHSQQSQDVKTSIDGNPGTGWAILPQAGQSHEAVFQLAEKLSLGEGEKLKIVLDFRSPHAQHSIGRLRLSSTADAAPADHWISSDLRGVLTKSAAERTDEDKQKLAAYYRDKALTTQPLREKLQQLSAQRQQFEESIPKTLISVSGSPRTVRILPRGNWLDDSGEVVEPSTPAFLGEISVEGRRPTRLDLAEWLVRPDHPLTARVMVNRMWRLMFGRGLTASVDDFGTQGEYPSHPELLDYLTVNFVENGWDVKRLIKQMVMSRTYRQTSVAPREMMERDPANVWLARQSRFRYDAEFVRDNALAVSGLLVKKIGGPSVFPYQPPGYWSYLNFPTREWQNSTGEGLYRRGLYTHWQRSFLHPSLLAFDATSREECTAERPRSNTPLQALVLLNDPTYVEAARALAAKAVALEGDAASRLEYVYQQTLQRSPREAEAKALIALYEKHLAEYQSDEKAAAELQTVGAFKSPENLNSAELAAWTSVARVVLNLHECITRN
jgi:hypothetical protein